MMGLYSFIFLGEMYPHPHFFLSGKPKGAMLTHANIIANTAAFLKTTEVSKRSTNIWNVCKHPLDKTSHLSRRDEQNGQYKSSELLQ